MEESKENQNTKTKGAWSFFIIMIIPAMIVGGVFYFWNQASEQMLQDDISKLKKQNEDFTQRNQVLSSENTSLREENDYYKKTIAPANGIQNTGATTQQQQQQQPAPSAAEQQQMRMEPTTNAGTEETLTNGQPNNLATNTPSNSSQEKYCFKEPEVSSKGKSTYPINIEKYGSIGYLGELFTAFDCGQDRMAKIQGVKDGQYTIWPDIGLYDNPDPRLLNTLKEIGFHPAGNCSAVQEPECKHWSLKKNVPISEILKLIPFSGRIVSSGCLNCN
jgi:hypothetical protein